MRRFLGSAWFVFLTCLLLAGVTVAAYALLKPTGEGIYNEQMLTAVRIAGWAVGPVMGVISLILMCMLNGIRRLLKLRQVRLLHPIIILLGILPWLIMGWQISGEPLYTTLAKGVVPFVARPMLWGSLVASIWTIVLSIPLLFPSKQS